MNSLKTSNFEFFALISFISHCLTGFNVRVFPIIGTLTTSEEQVRFKIESEESKDVATPWKANKSVERRDLSYHGPYGVELFSLGRIYALSFFLGGIGITGGSQMIFDCIEHFPQAKVYIFWSIKETDYLELTLFKGNFILI